MRWMVAILFVILGLGPANADVFWTETFESGTLGAFTDCDNPESDTWTIEDDPTVLTCGNPPCEGTYYALGDVFGDAFDKIDIMYTGPVDLTAATGKIEASFCWWNDETAMFDPNELHFYASSTAPSDPCDPNNWTPLWSNISSTCVFGEATVDLTPVVGCPATVNQVYLAFGYAYTLSLWVAVDNIRLNQGDPCPGIPGEDCSDPYVLTCGGSVSGDLSGRTNDYTEANYGCGGDDYDGGEDVWVLDIPQPQTVTIVLDDSEQSAMDVIITQTCPGGTCLGADDNTVTLNAISGPVYIFVDCPEGGEGSYELSASCSALPGENCSDPMLISCGDCVCGSTVGYSNDYFCDIIGYQAGDVLYRLNVASETFVTVIGEADYPASWAIASVCDDLTGDIACNETAAHQDPVCSAIEHGENMWITHTFQAQPGDYYIWVSGMWGGDVGNYCLEVQCSDGDTCNTALSVACDQVTQNNSALFTSTANASTYGSFALGDCLGPDVWHHLGSLAPNEEIRVAATGKDVYIMDGCTTCVASAHTLVQWQSTGNEDVYIVVDSNGPGSGGVFNLLITCRLLYSGITLGSAGCTNTDTGLPFAVSSVYYETQYCIPAATLESAGLTGEYQISELAWLLCSGTVEDDPGNTVDIWLANHAGECPDLCSGGLENGTLVASNRTFSGTGPEWITLELDSPFTYQPGNNLLISVCDTSGVGSQSPVQWDVNGSGEDTLGIISTHNSSPPDCDMTTGAPELCRQYWTTLGLDGTFVTTPSPTPTPSTPTHTPTPTPTPPPTNTPTVLAGNSCTDPIPLECGDCICRSSDGFSNTHDCEPDFWGHDGPDIVYMLTVPPGETYQIIAEAAFDADWSISTFCDPIEADILCADSAGPHADPICSTIETGNTHGDLNFIISQPGQYFVWLDGYRSSDAGWFCLELICQDVPTLTPTQTATPDIATSTPTAGPGNNCQSVIELPAGSCVCGSTQGYQNNSDCTDFSPASDHAGPDRVYHLYLEVLSRVHVIAEAAYDADWTIASVCGEAEGDVLCADWQGTHSDPVCSGLEHAPWSFINTEFFGTGDYYIWADGFDAEDFGEYCLEVQVTAVTTQTPVATSTPAPHTFTPTPTFTPRPPTHTPTVTQTPTATPTPTTTFTPLPFTATPTPSATPSPTPPVPTSTPEPSFTPTPSGCQKTGVEILMPAPIFHPGDVCWCHAIVCNAEGHTLTGYPLFVILDVLGSYFFAPTFGDFAFYDRSFEPGESTIEVLGEFNWPPGTGTLDGIIWYGAFTNPAMTDLFGELGIFSFGWDSSGH